MRFEWDEVKARKNVLNHGVSFEEAATVFDDVIRLSEIDDRHDYKETRHNTVGFSSKGRLLFVTFKYRGERIRIISARRASKKERKKYGQRR